MSREVQVNVHCLALSTKHSPISLNLFSSSHSRLRLRVLFLPLFDPPSDYDTQCHLFDNSKEICFNHKRNEPSSETSVVVTAVDLATTASNKDAMVNRYTGSGC